MSKKHTSQFLAVDLGAESGRVFLGMLDDDRLTLEEIHRFSNVPVSLPDGLYWNVLGLWTEIKNGVSLAVHQHHANPSSVAVDTWGVDFALLDRQRILLANPHHYRDSRTDGMIDEAFRCISPQELFEHTGLQVLQLNTLYQLLSMVLKESPVLEAADTLLTIPDLFNYWLSGEITNEFTNATTTQCFNPQKRDWAWTVLDRLRIPRRLFRKVSEPGTVIGNLRPQVTNELNIRPFPVVLTASHDTGSAVAAVPAEKPGFAWISSGTWSIMGFESPVPYLTTQMQAYNFTNEGGVFGTWRISKNIMGLWLVQECRRAWAKQGRNLEYTEIARLAEQAKPFTAVIDPDNHAFFSPGNMPERIREYCRRTGQSIPETEGEVARVALESIALKYRFTLTRLEEVAGSRLEPVYIIGGGSKNNLLNQLTANATNRPVIAGPEEATTIGNILMQASALGETAGLDQARQIVRGSCKPKTFMPVPSGEWDEAYGFLQELVKSH